MFEIKKIVNRLTKKYDTCNPFKIAEEQNIVILFENLGNTLGYYSSYKRVKIIHINNKLDNDFKIFVCAHELGHAVLHPNKNTSFLKTHTLFSTSKIEIEANTFAAELLILDEMIEDCKRSNKSIYDIAKISGVPEQLVHLKSF